jgi:hydrophobe/amphiphile efflux-1 (HAE1) family protein
LGESGESREAGVNPSAPFIRRPVATLLLSFGVLLLGAVGFSHLPIASLPAVERPTIAVYAGLPGASADTMASSVTQPLQRELGTIPGIVEMGSFSANGGVEIVIQFELETSIDAAATEVQAAINAASPNLPKDMPWPPYYREANPGGFAPVAVALTSEVVSPGELYDYADSVVKERLSEVPGVAEVLINGAERSAVRVQVWPRVLANMHLSLEQVRTALRAATQNLPKGSINVSNQAVAIGANDQLRRADDYRDLVVAYRNGAAVRLADVADVTDSVINTKLSGWFNDQRGVLVHVLKQPDANVVEIVDSVKALLPQLQRWLPPSVKVRVLYDRTALIRASIADVETTIEIAIALVVLVVALFLRRLWATLIPTLTIPVVIAATLVVMRLAGFSLDNLSLMAITISIGFIVDDAVIIVENITRHSDDGDDAISASLKSTRQMAFTVVSITGALLGALLPIVLMPDVVGRYFREFGVTLAAAIVASAVVSLTLIPMLCSRLFARRAEGAAPPPARRRSLPLRCYLRSLDFALTHPALVIVMLVLTIAGSAGLYAQLPKGFMPTQDIGILGIRSVTIPNVSFAAMDQLQRKVADIVLQDRAVEGLTSWIGTGNGSTLNNGWITASLKPLDERKESIQQVINRLRGELQKVPATRTFFRPWQDLQLGVQNSASRYQYTLIGSDADALWRWSDTMRRRMRTMPQLVDVISTAEASGLEAGLTMDRARAAAYGVTPLSLDNTLYDAFGQRQVRTIYLPSNFSKVILEVDPAFQADPSVLNDLFVTGVSDAQVPLASLMRPRRQHAAMWERHSEQFPAITLSFDTSPGVSLGEAITAIRAAENDIGLPDDIRAEFRGEAGEATKSNLRQILLFLGAIFAVYVMLGMLYESYAHPFTILTTLPSAAFGALLALMLTGTEFTLMAAIACLLVIGIVMKNAIMMVDFALAAQRQDGLSARDAIRLAAGLRARPILMTSLVAILSAVPLALGVGAGHELRQPLGIATVGGLLAAQVLTLYTTPVVFLLVDRLVARRRRKYSSREGALLPS